MLSIQSNYLAYKKEIRHIVIYDICFEVTSELDEVHTYKNIINPLTDTDKEEYNNLSEGMKNEIHRTLLAYLNTHVKTQIPNTPTE